jgi:hypothetical protein
MLIFHIKWHYNNILYRVIQMLQGECVNCGRNGWLDEERTCTNCHNIKEIKEEVKEEVIEELEEDTLELEEEYEKEVSQLAQFFKDPIVLAIVILQIVGPTIFAFLQGGFLNGFGTWANIIQYVSGFAFCGLYWTHKRELYVIKEHLEQANSKMDSLHKKHDRLYEKL